MVDRVEAHPPNEHPGITTVSMSRVALTLSNRKAPTTFRIWHAGVNETSKGPINFTPEAAQSVMSEFAKVGNKLAIDLEHASNPKANPNLNLSDPPDMGGYFELKIVPSAQGPELWATGVEWSDVGTYQIESGQRRYFSPDCIVDLKTREPTMLNRLALCAEPATYGLQLFSKALSKEGTTVEALEALKVLISASSDAANCPDPDVQALAAKYGADVSALASAKGIDLSAPAPESTPEPTAAPTMAAAPSAPAAPKKDEVKCATATLSLADVRRIFAEENEKASLILTNKDVLGATASLLATKSLSDVKSFIAAANVTASKRETAAAVHGPSLGEPKSESVSLVAIYKARQGKN